MARYLLTQDWPIASFAIPANTILDSSDWQWNSVPLPSSLPISAMALDQSAYDALVKQHPYYLIQSASDSSINRHADKKRN
jgi:hypothetical protein